MKANDTMSSVHGGSDNEYTARGTTYLFEYYERTNANDGGCVVVYALRNDDSVVWSGSTTYFDTMRVVDVVRDGRESAAMAKADGY
jgi:hypothetical protein